jgi:hypothetical protein
MVFPLLFHHLRDAEAEPLFLEVPEAPEFPNHALASFVTLQLITMLCPSGPRLTPDADTVVAGPPAIRL